MAVKLSTLINQFAKLQDTLEVAKEAAKPYQTKVDKAKANLKAKEDELLEALPAKDLTGVFGKTIGVRVEVQRIPNVKNWDKFWPWFHKNNAVDTLQRRVSGAAILERMEAGETVPGVQIFNRKYIKVLK